MKKIIKLLILLLTFLIVFVSTSCSIAEDEAQSDTETIADTVQDTDKVTEKKTTKSTKKTNKSTVKATDKQEQPTVMLKVMSQNMRSGNDASPNTRDERGKRFVVMLQEKQPDIIGTQEANQPWIDKFKKLSGYSFVGESRDGYGKTSGERCAIIYKTDRFKLVKTKTFWLTSTPDKVGKISSSKYTRICTWAVLTDKLTNQNILMVNTHLDNSTDAVRKEQFGYLFKNLDKVIAEFDKIDVMFLTGDFNCQSTSSAYKSAITYGFKDTRRIAKTDLSTKKGTFHNYNTGSQGTELDYCLIKGNSTVISYEIISKLYKGEGQSKAGVISDHYGLIATVQLTP